MGTPLVWKRKGVAIGVGRVWWLWWGGHEWVDDVAMEPAPAIGGSRGQGRGGRRPHMQMREVEREKGGRPVRVKCV